MILDLQYRRQYEIIDKNIFITDMDKLKHDNLFEESENKDTYSNFIDRSISLSPDTFNDIYRNFKEFILNNTRLKNYSSGDIIYEFSNSKIVISIDKTDIQKDIMSKIIGSIVYFVVGKSFDYRKKIIQLADVSKQVSYLLSRVGFRPNTSETFLSDINRYILLYMMSSNHIDIDNNYDKFLTYLGIPFTSSTRKKEFMDKNKDKPTESYFEEIANLLGLNISTLKQMFASKYGLDSILIFDDISHYFYLLFLSDTFKYKEVISSYLLSNKETEIFAKRSLEYVTFLVTKLVKRS